VKTSGNREAGIENDFAAAARDRAAAAALNYGVFGGKACGSMLGLRAVESS